MARRCGTIISAKQRGRRNEVPEPTALILMSIGVGSFRFWLGTPAEFSKVRRRWIFRRNGD
jgi:hypothetical protein